MTGRPAAVLVGAAGKQGTEYLDVLRDRVRWVGLIDRRSTPPAGRSGDIPLYRSVEEAIGRADFQVAVVTVPHHAHFDIAQTLLRSGKHVIKEKPLALNLAQARALAQLAMAADRSLLTIVQRNYREPFLRAVSDLRLIGSPYWYKYEYHMNLSGPTSGWRSDRRLAGGGVLVDMGYHVIDIVNRLFGPPANIGALFSYCFSEMERKMLDDVASLAASYDSGLRGTIAISRHHYRRTEKLEVLGPRGAIVVTPTAYRRYSRTGGAS